MSKDNVKKAKIGDILPGWKFEDLKFDLMIDIYRGESLGDVKRIVKEKIEYIEEEQKKKTELLKNLKEWNKLLNELGDSVDGEKILDEEII